MRKCSAGAVWVQICVGRTPAGTRARRSVRRVRRPGAPHSLSKLPPTRRSSFTALPNQPPSQDRPPSPPSPRFLFVCLVIAKFHYTGLTGPDTARPDPTGPARTFLRRNSVGSVRVSDKVHAGPFGSARVRSGPVGPV